MKVLFRDKLKSYFFVVALGLLAGFSVVFFIEVPDNSFWSFYYWSSSTFGFWMFSTSLIVLFSENRKCAAINAGIYIFLMFLITTVHQSFRLYRSGAMQPESLSKLIPNHIGGWLLYSVPPAFICAVLGIILWSGRKNTIWGKLLRTMPAVFVCGNGHSFLQCFCLSHKIFFGIKRSCLLSCVFGYFFKTGRNQQAIIFRLSLHNCFSEAAQTSKQKQGSSRRIVLFAVFIIALKKSP